MSFVKDHAAAIGARAKLLADLRHWLSVPPGRCRPSDMEALHLLLRRIQDHQQRVEAPLRDFGTDPRHVRTAWRHYEGKPLRELVVLNAGFRDCAWGHCRMCGLSTRARPLDEPVMGVQLARIARLPQLDACDSLFISPYSYFSDHEMSEEVRRAIYGIIAQHESIRFAVFMTRPDYLTEEKIRAMRTALPDKQLIVFMGAETSDPFIAKYCVDKGYCWPDVERAVEMLGRHDVRLGIWVLLKPPFLAEAEAIEDTIRTIRLGLALGASVRLMPMEVMDHTIGKLLAETGRFRTPWLWSVRQVLESFTPDERIQIDVSGPHFEREWAVVPREIHSTRISAFPENCHRCTQAVLRALVAYNEHKDIAILQGFDCECVADWRAEMRRPRPPLRDRLEVDMRAVAEYFLKTRSISVTAPTVPEVVP